MSVSGVARGLVVVLGLVLWMPGVSEASGVKLRTQYTGMVNLNEATVAQLDLLPGVGPKAAQRIIAWRQKRAFKRIEELVRVKGFGKKQFLKLKPYLTLEGPSSLKVEKVPVEEDEVRATGDATAKR